MIVSTSSILEPKKRASRAANVHDGSWSRNFEEVPWELGVRAWADVYVQIALQGQAPGSRGDTHGCCGRWAVVFFGAAGALRKFAVELNVTV